MTRLQKIERAIATNAKLTFDYMKIGQGRASVTRRIVDPLGVTTNRTGDLVLTAEDATRGGKPRSYRVNRITHMEVI